MTITEFKRMPRAERRRHVQLRAMYFAQERFAKDHPGCHPDAAFAFAERHWPDFQEQALDLVAIEAAIAEEQILAN